jgi:phosphatidylserine decarboxylase
MPAVSTPLRRASSHVVGWLADVRVPGFLRGVVYKGFARYAGADLSEARGPLSIYPSLSAFFVRQLVDGARAIDPDPGVIVSPVDGAVQAIGPVREGSVLQAKGHAYEVRELLAGAGDDVELEGGHAWTLYLGPRDYHRVHAPEAGALASARWVPGARYSVAPKVLATRPVLALNERCVVRLETARGPLFVVLVGALNVGRIRLVGVQASGPLAPPRPLARGAELGRFELGSTVVVVAPPGGPRPRPLAPGRPVRLGEPIGDWPA